MSRTRTELKNGWLFVREAADAKDALAKAAQGETITLPHTWNAVDGQDGGNDYYRGTCWYVLQIDPSDYETQDASFLEFEGAAYTSEVFVNGVKKSHHEDGFSTFRVDVTEEMKAGRPFDIVVSCNNAENDHVYPQKADFTFYGGLYRMVDLIETPAEHFALSYHGTNGLKVTPIVSEDLKKAEVTLEAWIEGTDTHSQKVTFTVTDAEGNKVVSADARTDEKGYAKAVVSLENVHLWNGAADPYLYTANASLDDGDAVSARFGCRIFTIDAEKGFFLNQKSYPLRGVSMHQDYKGLGNALHAEQLDEDMAFLREIGANTVRLAHYQHSQYFYDLCDENGIVVWAEIPFITQFMPNGVQNTLDQMTDLVLQNYNHASIAVWSLSNEITASSPVDEAMLENHKKLNDLCHTLDPTRKTSMANVFMLETDSPLIDVPDVSTYNLYYGWYVGDLKDNDKFFDDYHARFPQRAIGFSEYGADANPAFQAEKPERSDYTEGYQALYHEHILKLIEDRPYLWATYVWNLFDFAADGRDEGGKHGENQKGLVTFDRKIRKDAFYLYKAAWNRDEPFVHVCGSRYVRRECEETEIKVYSNQSHIDLYVDGNKAGEQDGHIVFTFHVKNAGTQTITAKSGELSDEITIEKVAEKEKSYLNPATGDVSNWFDASQVDPAFWSVEDTLGDLRADPKAGAIVNAMMAKASASRGDVAKSTANNKALQAMLAKMSLVSLLKQAGVDSENVKQLNRVLQAIPKKH